MTGLYINFTTPGAPTLCLEQTVVDIAASAQNALVNTVCRVGSDAAWPSRGTSLASVASSGALIDLSSSIHAANFATMNTLAFIRSAEAEPDDNDLANYTLQPITLENGSLRLNAFFTSVGGETYGVNILT